MAERERERVIKILLLSKKKKKEGRSRTRIERYIRFDGQETSVASRNVVKRYEVVR